MDNDDTFDAAPCRINNDISYDEYRARIRRAQQKLAEALVRVPGSQKEIDRRTRELLALREQTHPDMWFHDEDELSPAGRQEVAGQELVKALWTCKRRCPVATRMACLERGMKDEKALEHGVYGGYTAGQRRAIDVELTNRDDR